MVAGHRLPEAVPLACVPGSAVCAAVAAADEVDTAGMDGVGPAADAGFDAALSVAAEDPVA